MGGWLPVLGRNLSGAGRNVSSLPEMGGTLQKCMCDQYPHGKGDALVGAQATGE